MKTPRQQARELPEAPGVYLMYSQKNVVLYVGKAKNLRRRVASYFVKNRTPKTEKLVSRIFRIEYIVTPNELDALLLENNLIKTHYPKYNIDLKDCSSYPYIRMTNQKYPRMFATRNMVKDGSTYFGPYPKAYQVHRYLEMVEQLYPLRKCRGPLPKRSAPCLYYHIHSCKAPCCGYQTYDEYQESVAAHIKLLKGGEDGLRKDLFRSMKDASQNLQFEEAAKFRDMIEALDAIQEGPGVEDFMLDSRDYIAQVYGEEVSVYSVIKVRDGKVRDKETYTVESLLSQEEGIVEFATQLYENPGNIPPHLYIDGDTDSCDLLSQYLTHQGTRKIEVKEPQRGKHRVILDMARENGNLAFQQAMRNHRQQGPLLALQKALGLSQIPQRIEGYDISHLAGKYTIASMVCLIGGVPAKDQYRRYSIKTLGGKIDDFKALREATSRRYSRVIHDQLDPPQLILIDGGVGQVNGVEKIIDALGLDVPVCGLAKGDEEIILPKTHQIVKLPPGDPALQVLQRARDEAHRFATSLNQRIRTKQDGTFSLLESIPGVGPKRSKAILKEFGSLSAVANSTPYDVQQRSNIPEEVAELVVQYVAEFGDADFGDSNS